MNKAIFLIIFLVLPYFLHSQTICIDYKNEDKSFEVEICKDNGSNCTDFKGDIEIGKTYNVILSGINTAVINTVLEFKPFDLESTTPEIIQPIFPGITSSSQLNFSGISATTGPSIIGNPFSDLEDLSDNALEFYNKLLKLKKKSNTLYESTIFTTNNDQALSDFKVISNDFSDNTGTNEEKISKINQTIARYKNYINSVKDIFTKRLETTPDIPSYIVDKYSRVVIMSNDVENTNFTKYSNFIYQSIDSKDHTNPEPFIAKSDGTDLNYTLVNSYTNDTLTKKTFEFYTKGKLSFDFSTGFFYSNKIEQSYYLETRQGDTLKSNILKEPIRDFDISFGALGHFSYKFSSKFKAGISMGASLSIIDAKTRYLVGTSLIFGQKKQLALNAGLSLVKLKVLSDSIDQDQEGEYVDASVTIIPTFEKVQSGFFIGVTYNLTSKKKYDD